MAWWNNKKDFAQRTYDVLDPYYGEGGVLEPVTIIVDKDRTVKEEYVEPIVDYYEDTIEPSLVKAESYLKWGAAIGLLYVALK